MKYALYKGTFCLYIVEVFENNLGRFVDAPNKKIQEFKKNELIECDNQIIEDYFKFKKLQEEKQKELYNLQKTKENFEKLFWLMVDKNV